MSHPQRYALLSEKKKKKQQMILLAVYLKLGSFLNKNYKF